MNVFISYASEDRGRAEQIALALKAGGHEVFFDRSDLAGGEDFHSIIRKRIGEADLFVFLITPRALEPGSYTLTELRMVRDRWPHPAGHVLPVLAEPVPIDQIPAYLRGVTLFEPEGDLAAEVAAHLARRPRRRRALVVTPGTLAAFAVGVLAALKLLGPADGGSPGEAPFVSTIEPSQFISGISFPLDCEADPYFCVENIEYEVDPSSPLADVGPEMLGLERVAFGDLAPERESQAFNLVVALRNPGTRPFLLDLGPRFFQLVDDQGREAELLYFCCEARGVVLEAGGERTVQLIFRSPPGWFGKEISARSIFFRVTGLLPVTRAGWRFRPLATAA